MKCYIRRSMNGWLGAEDGQMKGGGRGGGGSRGRKILSLKKN